MPKITPFLWFADQAEEAANFYVSVFDNSRIVDVVRYTEAGPGPAGSVLTVAFELEGEPVTALNGGAVFTFNEAVSFVIHCADQAEVDRYWDALGEGGEPGPCGWVKDRYGLSWQIVPETLLKLIADPDRAKAKRVTEVMLKMGKLDIAQIEAAAAGEG
jgi:predicted 3-demethylubiquinone-9 3-methyltransferase (glyoxalase superfamily)